MFSTHNTDKLWLTMLIVETFLKVQKVSKPFNDFMRRFYVIQVIAQFSNFLQDLWARQRSLRKMHCKEKTNDSSNASYVYGE